MSLQRPFRVLLLLLLPLLLVLLRVAADSQSMPLDGASDEMDELDEEMWPTEESAAHEFQFQEQSVPQHSVIDAVIIWILRNPSEVSEHAPLQWRAASHPHLRPSAGARLIVRADGRCLYPRSLVLVVIVCVRGVCLVRPSSQFAIGCACVLLPLFLLAMMSAYIMIRTMDQEKAARQEQQEEEQKQIAQAPSSSAAGASGAQGKAARSKQRAVSKESPMAGGAADGLTRRPTAAAAPSS